MRTFATWRKKKASNYIRNELKNDRSCWDRGTRMSGWVRSPEIGGRRRVESLQFHRSQRTQVPFLAP